MALFLDFPFHVDGRGRSAETAEDDHIRDMIFQVLFTNPGERVNRPDFGCGVKQLVFMPNSDALATATQFLVQGSLQRWLDCGDSGRIRGRGGGGSGAARDRRLQQAFRGRPAPGRVHAGGTDVGDAMMPSIAELGPICRDAKRRADILAHPVLNGIDFVEYERRPLAIHKHVLVVTFLKPLPDPPHSDPDGAYGLTLPANLGLVIIQGGTRIVNIRPLQVSLVGGRLEIAVSEEGDFSTYVLALGWSLQPDGTFQQQIPALDVQFSIAPINFKAGCPTDFDCRELEICPPERLAEPVIDYLAKDYASFRQLLIDLIPQLNPGWIERSPPTWGSRSSSCSPSKATISATSRTPWPTRPTWTRPGSEPRRRSTRAWSTTPCTTAATRGPLCTSR